MKTVLHEIKTAVLATCITGMVLCGIYPLLVWAGGNLLFPKQAAGSLMRGEDGNVLGSELLGQNFSGPAYFHSRPSAAGAQGYDGAASGGSNLGPTSRKLADLLQERIESYRKSNGLAADVPVPADAVTASGSGLDPHISVANAMIQLSRVARERGLSEEQVRALVEKFTDPRSLGFLGEAGVNVLQLNLALDRKGGS